MTPPSTKSPTKAAPPEPTWLATLNPFERDKRIVFDEKAHCYYIDGVRYPTSVSGIVHDCFPCFDAAGTIDKYYESWRNNKENKYSALIRYLSGVLGFDDELIKAEIATLWSSSGRAASSAGTHTHLQIELSLNDLTHDDTSAEHGQYMAWRATKDGWTPFRTEWSVFDDETLVCGQIDSVWRDQDGAYRMVDWKRCAELKTTGFRGECGFPPFSDLPSTNWGHYVVQQNLYAWMLLKNYGIECASLALLQVHPDLEEAKEWLLPRLFLPGGPIDLLMDARRVKVSAGDIRVVEASGTKRKHVSEDDNRKADLLVRKQLALERAIEQVKAL